MSFANHNILDIALSIIPSTVVQVRKNLGTKVNKYGQSEATYTEWIEVYGIVQPGSEQNEHTERIDFSKKTVTIWLRGYSLDGTHLQWAPDQIRYTDRIFNVTSIEDWFPYDNYRRCECVEVLNLGQDQRGANLSVPQRPKRVKVIPKREGQPSVDNQKVFEEAINNVGGEAEKRLEPQTETNPPPVPTDAVTAPSADNSKVGKGRIKF